jgi:AAA domain
MDVRSATMSRADGPSKTAIHTVHGYGKTTLAAHFPAPIFVGPERGVPRDLGFSVPELHPRKWLDLFSTVHSLAHDAHDRETVVFDTIDWIEPLLHAFVCERDSDRETEMNPKARKLLSIEDYGWGKGYLVAEEEFRKLIAVLDEMQARRPIHVVMLMHSQTKTFKNPAGPDYDRWEPKPHYRVARVVGEWAENMLFGFFQVDAAKLAADVQRNDKTAKAKGIGSGIRVVGAQECAMYDAKNRVGLPREFELGEDVGPLIGALLGEDVATHGRRAPIRERKQAGNWVDDAKARREDSSREAARENAQAHVERGSARGDIASDLAVSDTRRDARDAAQVAGRELERNAKKIADDLDEQRRDAEHDARDARNATRGPTNDHQTNPSRPPANDEASRAARDAHPNAPRDEKTRGNGHAATDTASDRMARALGDALERARRHNEKYGRDVDGWVKKAGNDPHRIQSIIDKVNKDLVANPQR